jgi:4-amino-4-deoxy-L-arabinose transferase-like glycosyltransferase
MDSAPLSDETNLKRATRWAYLVIALAAVCWPLGLTVDVQDHDEALYAEIAREMMERGGVDWWDTPNNWWGWFGHPVMSMWIVALGYLTLGISPWAMRVPAGLEALLLVGVTWWLGRKLWGRFAGPVAAAFFAALPAVSLMGHNVKTDMNLLLFITLSVVCGLRALDRPAWWLGSAAAAGLAVLTKGPFGLAMPGAVVLFAALWEREPARRLARAWPWLLAGLAVFAAVVLPWNLAMADRHGKSFINTQIMGSTFERFSGSKGSGDGTTPLYFLHTLLWAAAPLVPAGLWGLWQRVKEIRGRWRTPPWPTVDLLWLVVPLLVMSFSAQKLPHYIFPVLPALCATAARGVLHLADAATPHWTVRLGTAGLNALALAFSLALITVAFPPAQGFLLLGVWLAGMVVVVLTTWRMLRGDVMALWVAPSCAAILIMAMHNGAARPELANYSPARMVASVLDADNVPRGTATEVIAPEDFARMSIVFATRCKLGELDWNKVQARVGPGPRYMLLPASDLHRLRDAGLHYHVRGFAFSYPTSRLSIPFSLVDNRPTLATPTVLVQAFGGTNPP